MVKDGMYVCKKCMKPVPFQRMYLFGNSYDFACEECLKEMREQGLLDEHNRVIEKEDK